MAQSATEQYYNSTLDSLSLILLLLQDASHRLRQGTPLSQYEKFKLPKLTIDLFGHGSYSDFDRVVKRLCAQASLIKDVLERVLSDIVSSVLSKAKTEEGSTELLYRYINRKTKGGYAEVGVYSTALQSGSKHVGDLKDEFKDHCNMEKVNTRYISATPSPCRLLNFIGAKNAEPGIWKEDRSVVMVIDKRKLRAFDTIIESTKVIAKQFDIKSPKISNIEYISEDHILVSDWIPTEAVVRMLYVKDFKRLCQQEIGIYELYSREKEILKKRLTLQKVQDFPASAEDSLTPRLTLKDLHQKHVKDEIECSQSEFAPRSRLLALRSEVPAPPRDERQSDDVNKLRKDLDRRFQNSETQLEDITTQFQKSNTQASEILDRMEKTMKAMKAMWI